MQVQRGLIEIGFEKLAKIISTQIRIGGEQKMTSYEDNFKEFGKIVFSLLASKNFAFSHSISIIFAREGSRFRGEEEKPFTSSSNETSNILLCKDSGF